MIHESDKLADKITDDLIKGQLVSWAARIETQRLIRNSIQADEDNFRRLNEESYGRER